MNNLLAIYLIYISLQVLVFLIFKEYCNPHCYNLQIQSISVCPLSSHLSPTNLKIYNDL